MPFRNVPLSRLLLVLFLADQEKDIPSLNSNLNYLQINPKDKLIIPIAVEFSTPQDKSNKCFKKTMSFDIWTSLYKDPINYSFTINAKYENTVQDKLVAQQQTDYNGTESKYNIIYK